jgi:hypothetical protein
MGEQGGIAAWGLLAGWLCCHQYPNWLLGAALTVGHVGEHFQEGNFIFGKEACITYPSGMFLHVGGSRGEQESIGHGTQKSGLPN